MMLGMPIVLNQPTQLNPNSEYSTTSVLRAGSEVKKISVVGTASAKHAKLITAASVSDTLFSLHTSFATANMTNVLAKALGMICANNSSMTAIAAMSD